MLGAYKNASANNDDKKKGKTGAEHVPLVHKPVFEKVNSRAGEILEQQRAEQENLEKAKIAAKTGVWFGAKKKAPTEDDVKKAAAALTAGALIKVPEQPKEPGEKESIYRRVAKFLVIIGVDEAAKVIPRLTESQIDKIVPEIATIQSVPKDEAEAILEEFQGLLDKARESGGLDTARTILTKAYGSERAEEVLEKSVGSLAGKPFDFLQEADAKRIGVLIDGESAAVQSLVLTQIAPKKSAQILNSMDSKRKGELILRLAKMKPVAPQVVESVSKSLHEKMLSQNTERSQDLDGRGVLAQILKRMNPVVESEIIANLAEEDPELGADIRKRLFTEDDVIHADDRFMQNKLHDMDNKTLAILIRGKSDEFRRKILSNLSRRRAAEILDEEQITDFVLKSDSERITSQFFADLRRAWEEGSLRVIGRDDGEIYVE